MKWISVKDDLPMDYHSVIAYIRLNDEHYWVAEAFVDSNGKWDVLNGCKLDAQDKVIYWMQLPSLIGPFAVKNPNEPFEHLQKRELPKDEK